MSKYILEIKCVYTFYTFGEELMGDVLEERWELSENEPTRHTLPQQEDGSFLVSQIHEDYIGKYVLLTYPNKDNLVVHLGEEQELVYDEYYSTMGDDNHNVYEGTVRLIKS